MSNNRSTPSNACLPLICLWRSYGGKFMEYVHDYDSFPTIPYKLMLGEWKKHYRGFERPPPEGGG